ncbi:DnaB-like helicase C-terminal domain-containing protein [Sulfurimonas hydrogeniphila]|uniref:DnaB-like helicase C-terminal domain-containing protein n=1 Tax=Sulfurimonas hydrogeniphila TaxID=2509341 RepID=UPI003242B0D3
MKKELSVINSEDTGITTGFNELDNRINKFRNKELNVIAARVGFGKTSFILSSVLENIQQNNNVLYFSLDLTKIQLLKKIISMTTNIPLNNLKNATDFLIKEIEKFGASINNLYIDDSKYITFDYIKKISKKMVEKNNIKMIVIDYFQLIENHNNSNLAREFKKLAIELDLPIILLSQLDKSIENRINKRPYIRDIQNNYIEMEANTIIMIYIPQFYEEDIALTKEENALLQGKEPNNCYIQKREPDVTISIIKNIYGTSTLNFVFQFETGKFFSFEFDDKIMIHDKEIMSLLQKMNATFCYSSGLSKEIIKDISILYVDKKDIENIPEDVFSLVNLKELILKNNTVRTISPNIYKLKKLAILSLANNHLESLPADIDRLHNLRELDISNNPTLKVIPENFSKLSLRYLSIDGNLLNKDITIIENIYTLQEVVIHGGLLSEEVFKFLAKLVHLRKIEFISIENNTIARSIGNLTIKSCERNLENITYEMMT